MRLPSEDTSPVGEEAPTATPGGNAKEKNAPAIPSNWEEITVLLKTVPCFTLPESPASSVEEFFPFSHHHFVNLRDNPRLGRVVRPSHVTPDSALWCTYLLLKYTAEKTSKVVGFIPLLSKFA